jgi:hypothetical protein
MARPVAVHEYRDPMDGEPFARKKKYVINDEKRFVWERRVGEDGWKKGLEGRDPGLYNAHLLERAVKEHLPVHLTEGEKDADALLAAHPDWVVTSVPHGAGDWEDAWRDVTIYPDDDSDGHGFAARVEASLCAEGQKVAVRLAAEGCTTWLSTLRPGTVTRGARSL